MTDEAPQIAAIVLAAGQGTRFAARAEGAFKLLAAWKGVPLVRHVVQTACASRARPVIVVTGHAHGRVHDALSNVHFIATFNAMFETGLASSLRAGLAAVPASAAATLVLLGDMPRVTAPLLDAMIEAFACDSSCDAVVPVYEGRRGNPVLLARSLFSTIATLTGDEGARRLLSKARVVEVPASEAVTFDVDTPDMLCAPATR